MHSPRASPLPGAFVVREAGAYGSAVTETKGVALEGLEPPPAQGGRDFETLYSLYSQLRCIALYCENSAPGTGFHDFRY